MKSLEVKLTIKIRVSNFGWFKIPTKKYTLPKTNSSPLKMDGCKTIVSFWGSAYFQGYVSFREGIFR